MRILVGSASASTCLTTALDSCMARDPGCEFTQGAPDARPEPALALAGPVARRGDLILIDHQPDGDAALLLIGHVPIRNGAEPHGQDPRDLHTLLDEET